MSPGSNYFSLILFVISFLFININFVNAKTNFFPVYQNKYDYFLKVNSYLSFVSDVDVCKLATYGEHFDWNELNIDFVNEAKSRKLNCKDIANKKTKSIFNEESINNVKKIKTKYKFQYI